MDDENGINDGEWIKRILHSCDRDSNVMSFLVLFLTSGYNFFIIYFCVKYLKTR